MKVLCPGNIIRFLTMAMILGCSITYASTLTSQIYDVKGVFLGTVVFEDSKYGLLVKPQLQHLPPGVHGFHIHQHANCDDHGLKAGGHFDPALTNSHQGPYGQGHLGDLPILFVDEHGQNSLTILAPRLKTTDIGGHALMIHEGGDNYSDIPALGGGGARIGCGKIPK